MKLLKLIYLSDRLHLRLYGRTISTDVYYAIGKGPVASNVYDKCKQIAGTQISLGEDNDISLSFERGSQKYTIRAKKDADLKIFSKSEIDIVDKVFETFGHKEGHQLSEISHDFYEWKQFENALKNKSTSFTISFEDFFETEDNGTIFESPKERLLIIKALYKEDHELQAY
jgi:uncharacterized phage-associated protein